MSTTAGAAISKRRKFVADGVFYAELNEFFQRELAEEGYSGVEVRVTPTVTDISTAASPPTLQVSSFESTSAQPLSKR
jgi:small subunit ribosomal protein S3e